jgi:hypothetical protein
MTTSAKEMLDVVIPGAQKAGTSSVLESLAAHPQIVRHPTAELPALLDPDADLHRVVAEQLPPVQAGELRLAKSVGVMHQEGAFERLRNHNPDLRLVFMLREPVDRMYSAYWFARRTGDEPLDSFADAVAREGRRTEVPIARRARLDYRRRSDYVTPLRRATELFGRDHVRVHLLEEFAADQSTSLDDLLTWLGLSSDQLDATPVIRNQASGVRSRHWARAARSDGAVVRAAARVLPHAVSRRARRTVISLNERAATIPALDEALRSRLVEQFIDHNRVLAEEFGVDLTRWNHT